MNFRFSFVCLVALGLFAIQANAQSLTNNPNGIPGPTTSAPCAGPVTQSVDCAPAEFLGVSCSGGGIVTDNYYLRRFDLEVEFGIVNQFDVASVDFSVETTTDPMDVTLELWSIASGDPFLFANMTPFASATVSIPAGAALLEINAPIAGSLVDPTSDDLVVSILTPDCLEAGLTCSYFPGANDLGQTGPSYIAAADCGIVDPLDYADIGFPGTMLTYNINGIEIPVELVSFTATTSGTNVNLNWATASETNNAGFEVQVQNGESWNALGFVEGHGTTTEAQTYNYSADMAVGTHTFRLKQIDFDGAFEYSDELEVSVETPGSHVLTSAYPNPFNPQSQFTLAVAQDQLVTAELYNTLGQRVATLFSGTVEANQAQQITIDGAGLASGMYVVRVNGERFNDALSVTLLK